MNERQATSLAARRAPAPRAVFARLVPALAAASLLAACGQKGPLFLPSTNPASARPIERLPSAPDDAMPRDPAIAPAPTAGASAVVPAR